jgi:murein DD-endopeptidase MepM/ murein hydrolase activator NlpD
MVWAFSCRSGGRRHKRHRDGPERAGVGTRPRSGTVATLPTRRTHRASGVTGHAGNTQGRSGRFHRCAKACDTAAPTKRLSLYALLLLLSVTSLSLGSPGATATLSQTTPLPSPVAPACISSPFGPRVLRGRPLAGTFHNGIDLPAPAGAPVRAIASGEIIRVERRGVGGLQLLVQHPGFVGVYGHLGMVVPAIAEGQRTVVTGEKLGVVGHSGLTYGMHLFFGMIVGGQPVDPAPYLALSPCGDEHRVGGR